MSVHWPEAPLGNVLAERQEVPDEQDILTGKIRIISKIGFNDGKIQLREESETKTKMILIRPGDLVVSGINAAKGAIAIYGEENEEPVAATIHYGSYIPNKSKVNVKYLWWLLRSNTFKELLNKYVPWGIKTELKAKRLLPVPIPLPPLSGQRKIVAKIEILSDKIEKVEKLRGDINKENSAIVASTLFKIFNKPFAVTKPLLDICKEGAEQISALEAQEEIYLSLQDVQAQTGVILRKRCAKDANILGTAVKFNQKHVLYSKLRPYLNKVVVPEFNGIGTTEFIVLEPNLEIVERDYLAWYLRSPQVVDKLVFHSAGTKMPRANLKQFRNLEIPIISKTEQNAVINTLKNLQKRITALNQIEAKTEIGYGALQPSILDKAFKGEL